MLFHYFISVLFIAVSQAAPRPVSNALNIRNPAWESDNILPTDTEIGTTEPTEKTDPNGQLNNYDAYTGDEEPQINTEPYVTSMVPGETSDEGDQLFASARTPSTSNVPPVQTQQESPVQNQQKPPVQPQPDETNAPQTGAPGGDTQPPDPQNYGSGTADCEKKTSYPWTDSGCAINFPGSLPASGFVQCQQHGKRAECRVCVNVVKNHCRPYKTIDLPEGVSIPQKVLIPQGKSLY